MFHIDISGINFNDEHSLNIKLIFVTLFVFHLEISGNDDNDKQPEKRLLMFVTLLTPFNLISSLSLTFLTSKKHITHINHIISIPFRNIS